MKHFRDEWIQEWCDENGWTDLYVERCNHYWAFPPQAVMPEPIPGEILRAIKAKKGLCQQEKVWLFSVGIISFLSLVTSWFLRCPLPIVFAFAFDAITVARLEVELI
ncbi:MAG: hypothetical protein D6756_08965 [Cyanobacteria bacterium J083]|nr:MAG: hypothetical protein D6756_08965 [Cyanobacteria bacterium J083]